MDTWDVFLAAFCVGFVAFIVGFVNRCREHYRSEQRWVAVVAQLQAAHAEQLKLQRKAFREALVLFDYGDIDGAIEMLNAAGVYPEEPKRRPQ
jgi:hypothetical protein